MATNRTTILATTALWACLIATCTDAKYLEIVRPSKEDRSLGEVRGLEDIALEEFGATPASNKMPLQRCQGDCDTDDDVSLHGWKGAVFLACTQPRTLTLLFQRFFFCACSVRGILCATNEHLAVVEMYQVA